MTGANSAARACLAVSGSGSYCGIIGPNGSGFPLSAMNCAAARMISTDRASHCSLVAPRHPRHPVAEARRGQLLPVRPFAEALPPA
jgi:hypothetical protein